jgi:hypothetical protein
MDKLIKYDPTKFPGATFESGEEFQDCQVCPNTHKEKKKQSSDQPNRS